MRVNCSQLLLYSYNFIGLPPSVTSGSPGMVTVKVGENMLLACTATGTQPIKYEWLKDGNKMPLQGKYM